MLCIEEDKERVSLKKYIEDVIEEGKELYDDFQFVSKTEISKNRVELVFDVVNKVKQEKLKVYTLVEVRDNVLYTLNYTTANNNISAFKEIAQSLKIYDVKYKFGMNV